MTAQERAEKIVNIVKGSNVLGESGIEFIAARIEEAEREADRRNKDAIAVVVRLSREDAYKEGYDTAKEQAAKIADSYHPSNVAQEIEDEIRAMKPDGEKE